MLQHSFCSIKPVVVQHMRLHGCRLPHTAMPFESPKSPLDRVGQKDEERIKSGERLDTSSQKHFGLQNLHAVTRCSSGRIKL
jgi:hypothetical protein